MWMNVSFLLQISLSVCDESGRLSPVLGTERLSVVLRGFVQTLELDFLLIRRGSQWVTFRSSLGTFLGAQKHNLTPGGSSNKELTSSWASFLCI